MDINKALNEIIFKYHLDKCYPHYENMYQAEIILKEMMKEIKQNSWNRLYGKNMIRFISYLITELSILRDGSGFITYNMSGYMIFLSVKGYFCRKDFFLLVQKTGGR